MRRLLQLAREMRETVPAMRGAGDLRRISVVGCRLCGPIRGDDLGGQRAAAGRACQAAAPRNLGDARRLVGRLSLDDGSCRSLPEPRASDKPLVLADSSDNPGAGGYGDSVVLLSALLDAGVEGVALAAIADPAAAARAVAAGPGANVRLDLGGQFEPGRYGGPLACEATVIAVSDGLVKLSGPMMNGVELSLGPSAALRIGAVKVVVVTHNTQVFDRSIFAALGIDPLAERVLVVKSSHHFRSDFDEFAGRIVLVDAGGPVSPAVGHLRYDKLRKPIWPLEAVDRENVA